MDLKKGAVSKGPASPLSIRSPPPLNFGLSTRVTEEIRVCSVAGVQGRTRGSPTRPSPSRTMTSSPSPAAS